MTLTCHLHKSKVDEFNKARKSRTPLPHTPRIKELKEEQSNQSRTYF